MLWAYPNMKKHVGIHKQTDEVKNLSNITDTITKYEIYRTQRT